MTDQDMLLQLQETGPEWASKRARLALMLWEQYEGGGVDELEYQENMRRIVSDDHIGGYDDVDTKAALVTAVLGLAGEL